MRTLERVLGSKEEWGHWCGGLGSKALVIGGHGEEPHLACCAVGHTGAPVAAQVEVGGTGTLVAPAGGQEAQVAAATIVDLAGVIGHCRRERG